LEQAQLHEALLRSKADSISSDGIMLARLTFHNPDVMAYLQSKELETCRVRVEGSGCSVRPDWAKGAILLVPVTEQQTVEADIELKPHNILMLHSDLQLVEEALAKLARCKRPGLKPEHYPYGKSEVASNGARVVTFRQTSGKAHRTFFLLCQTLACNCKVRFKVLGHEFKSPALLWREPS